jgi:organic hydroperoxide reductase OsmC/OhrA
MDAAFTHTEPEPPMPNHDYTTRILWTGNRGEGTAHYKAYDRTWDIAVPGKAPVHCSNDPLLGGDPSKMNPEDLLLSALSSCHMLWYLHYASDARDRRDRLIPTRPWVWAKSGAAARGGSSRRPCGRR